MSLEALRTCCREHGIHGSYRCAHKGDRWRARIKAGRHAANGLHDTREAALDRIAEGVLARLTEQPTEGGPGRPYDGIYDRNRSG